MGSIVFGENTPAALPEWSLDDLYTAPGCVELKRDIELIANDSKVFERRYRDTVITLATGEGGGKRLAEAIESYEALQCLSQRVFSYAFLHYAGDTAAPERAKFFGDIQAQLTTISAGLIFFELEINQIDDADFDSAIADPALDHYAPWLKDLRKVRSHQLDDRLERLFHEKSITGRSAWNRLFDNTIAALRFNVDGKELQIEPTLDLLLDRSPEKRKAAAQALAETLGAHLPVFTLITNTLAKDKEISDRWRHFDDIADSRHLANQVEREVVEALAGAVQDAYPRLSHRYYTMKAKWLGQDTLAHWDRNAPLPEEDAGSIAWADARHIVLDAYNGFAPWMAEIAGRFFDHGWIDASVRPGKMPGAFAHPTVPDAHPYVLLNYQGRPRDVMTLAHELGHGVHQVLAAEAQGLFLSSTPLTLAETASVFGERLAFQALLAQRSDPSRRKALLASAVEDMLSTAVRQIAFYSFERKIHAMRRKGELTAEQIGEIWLQVQAESLGPAVTLGPGYETFWAYIPHFIHSPFYVYAYSFGNCLVNSLYALYEDGHDGFAEKYHDMLKAGGSKHHSELLAPFGLDARDAAFWSKGLGVIERMIDRLEAQG
ncbi:MAG: M3 family oligoendopeptidase [Hyphomicrobiales bacterium]